MQDVVPSQDDGSVVEPAIDDLTITIACDLPLGWIHDLQGDDLADAVAVDAGQPLARDEVGHDAGGDVVAPGAAIYTGLSGTFYPALAGYNTNDFGTLRVLTAEFSYTPPSGYLPWGQ